MVYIIKDLETLIPSPRDIDKIVFIRTICENEFRLDKLKDMLVLAEEVNRNSNYNCYNNLMVMVLKNKIKGDRTENILIILDKIS